MLGVSDYLRKPFAMDVLLEAVERVIGNPGSDAGDAADAAGTGLKARRTPRRKADDNA